MKKLFLFILLAGVTLGAENPCNMEIDILLDMINRHIRQKGGVLIPIHPYNFHEANVSHAGGLFIGADSLKRTDDCTMSFLKTGIELDLHLGFGLLTSAFGELTINGQAMSGYYRVRDNSVNVVAVVSSLSKRNEKYPCNISLKKIEVEKLDNATLSSSIKEYDNLDVSEFYRETVKPALNALINAQRKKIDEILPELCKWFRLKKDISELLLTFMS